MEHVIEIPETAAQRRLRRLKRIVINLLLVAATYGLVVLAARLLHRQVVYQPPAAEAATLDPSVNVIEAHANDGVTVHALEVAGRSATTVVHFHGNAETADQNLALAHRLSKHGLRVVLVEYRGYGRSKGDASTETGLYADAEAILAELERRGTAPRDIVLWGQSLGTGVATEMARRGRGSKLVLVAPFASTTALAQSSVPFLPASLVMVDAFDNLAKAPSIALPVLVVHGDADTVIPLEHGKRLAAAFPHAELREVGGGTHENLYKNVSTFDALVAFVTH